MNAVAPTKGHPRHAPFSYWLCLGVGQRRDSPWHIRERIHGDLPPTPARPARGLCGTDAGQDMAPASLHDLVDAAVAAGDTCPGCRRVVLERGFDLTEAGDDLPASSLRPPFSSTRSASSLGGAATDPTAPRTYKA